MKYADEIIKEIEERGPAVVPDGYMAGEDFDEWLYGTEDDYAIERHVWHNCNVFALGNDYFQLDANYGEAA